MQMEPLLPGKSSCSGPGPGGVGDGEDSSSGSRTKLSSYRGLEEGKEVLESAKLARAKSQFYCAPSTGWKLKYYQPLD